MDPNESSHGSSSLSDMLAVACFIDRSIVELDQTLLCADGLMSTEENQPQAEKFMVATSLELKELEEHSRQLKLDLKNELMAFQNKLSIATASNDAIEEGILEIENTLKQYGYDGSSMPAFAPEIDTENDNDGDDSESSFDEAMEKSPASRRNQLNESMADVEITPLVLSSKSRRSLQSGVSPFLQTLSSQRTLKIPVSFSSKENPYINGSSHKLKNWAARNIEKEDNENKSVKPTTLVRPQRPILSKTTYELLGEEPPPEFFQEHRS